jgi:hypothetical protein
MTPPRRYQPIAAAGSLGKVKGGCDPVDLDVKRPDPCQDRAVCR